MKLSIVTASISAPAFNNAEVLYVLLAAGARVPEDKDDWTTEERERCEAALARHEGMLRVAVPALREYFCDPLMMIMFAYAHAPVHRSDLPLAATETIAGRVKRRRRYQ